MLQEVTYKPKLCHDRSQPQNLRFLTRQEPNHPTIYTIGNILRV
jgi:hypothetical protein